MESYIGRKLRILPNTNTEDSHVQEFKGQIGVITCEPFDFCNGKCIELQLEGREDTITVYIPGGREGIEETEWVDKPPISQSTSTQEVITRNSQYIGKQVRVLPNAIGRAGNYIGQIVTVISILCEEDDVVHATASDNRKFSLITPLRIGEGEFEVVNDSTVVVENNSPIEVGDYVTCIEYNNPNDPNYNDYEGKGAGWQLGLTFQVTGIEEENKIYWGGLNTNGVYFNAVRRATQQEINTVKEGEKKVVDYTQPFICPTIDTTTYKGKLLDCIINHPENISVIKAEAIDRKYYDKCINQILPFKVGIEVECLGAISSSMKSDSTIREYLNCISYTDDDGGCNNEILREQRMCFLGHKQVMALYKFCGLLSQHCTLATNGGIHYHFDCPELKGSLSNCTDLKEYLLNNNYLDKINEVCKYVGTYNKKEIGISEKGTWINLRRSFGTIEVRIAAPKFDYQAIVYEIIALSKIISKVREEMKFKKYKL